MKLSLKGHCLVIISCFHDYGQELAFSLLYFLKTGRNKSPKAMNAEKYEQKKTKKDKIATVKLKIPAEWKPTLIS